jgi:methionine-rich copper-binding protein CopC
VAQTLDTPPFAIAGRTLVPLRFISSALGATVAFDQRTQTVAVTQPLAAVLAPPPPPAPQTPAPDQLADLARTPPAAGAIAMRLVRLEPADRASVDAVRPEISATFSEPVDPDTVRIAIDGRDVTPDAYVNDRTFTYEPQFALPQGTHAVTVTGKTPERESFSNAWGFTSRAATSGNYLTGLEPPNGTPEGPAFTISGITRPGSAVHVIVVTSETQATFSENVEPDAVVDVRADARGDFEAKIVTNETRSGPLDLRIVSTASDGSVATRTLRLRR